MKAGIYARVSTGDQTTENQLLELRRYATARGWEIKEFIDHGFSGALTEDKRPDLKRLMKEVRLKKIDSVIVWDFSRFARSMQQLVSALEEFRGLDVDFISHREGIDTSTANGRLIFGIFASIAEFEREMIRERVMSGINRARSQGKHLGRPRIEVDTDKILELSKSGKSLREIQAETGFNRMTVSRALKAMAQNPPSILAPSS